MDFATLSPVNFSEDDDEIAEHIETIQEQLLPEPMRLEG